MDILGFVIPFLLVLTVVVFIHELGHYLVGRWCGIGAEAFSIGFGPELFGFVDKRGTRWRFAALPLGGYVKFIGDRDPASSRPGMENVQGSFQSASLGARAATVAAGPGANFLLSIVIFSAMAFVFGEVKMPARVDVVSAGSPAAEAGFLPGDVIVEVDGREVEDFSDVTQSVMAAGPDPLMVVVERNKTFVELTVVPEAVDIGEGATRSRVYRIGIQFQSRQDGSDVERVSLGPIESIGAGIDRTLFIVSSTIDYVGRVLVGTESGDQLGGPIRIAHISDQVADMGILPLINLIALLSTSIGLINLFPLPILDGGHLVFYAVEALTGKPVSERVQEIGARIGIALVLFLMVFTTWNDLKFLGLF